jgi:hypothetical protein
MIAKPEQMRYATVYTTEKEYSRFIELAKSLSYVTRIETDREYHNSVTENIRTGLKEVKLFQAGQLETTDAKDFLNEI